MLQSRLHWLRAGQAPAALLRGPPCAANRASRQRASRLLAPALPALPCSYCCVRACKWAVSVCLGHMCKLACPLPCRPRLYGPRFSLSPQPHLTPLPPSHAWNCRRRRPRSRLPRCVALQSVVCIPVLSGSRASVVCSRRRGSHPPSPSQLTRRPATVSQGSS